MSDPEVGETVAALVAAFADGLAAVESRYTDLTRVHGLRMDLRQLGPAIGAGYQNKLSEVGPEYAVGDDICRRELRACLEVMERDVVAALKGPVKSRRDAEGGHYLIASTTRGVHSRAKKALDAQRDRMKQAKTQAQAPAQQQSTSAGSSGYQPSPAPETSHSSAGSSNGNASGGAPPQETGKTAARLSRLIPTSMQFGPGWGRTRRVQQYCSAALWQQGAGVAKEGVGPGLVGCPDCKWGHQNYPPDLITLSYGQPEPNTILYVFKQGKRRDVTHWKLPHPFFAKSHLDIPASMVLSQSSLRGHQVFGCILCDKKKKVRDFDDAEVYARHVKEEHSVKEFKSEVDVVELTESEYGGSQYRSANYIY